MASARLVGLHVWDCWSLGLLEVGSVWLGLSVYVLRLLEFGTVGICLVIDSGAVRSASVLGFGFWV